MSHSPVSSADSGILDIDTVPSSTETSTTDVFPRLVGPKVSNIRIEREPLISPAISGFTFNLDLEPTSPSTYFSAHTSLDNTILPEVTPLSFADTFTFTTPIAPHAVSRPPTTGPRSPGAMSDDGALARSESVARRTQYFDNVFSNGNANKESARERVQRDSPIIAELRTNVIIKDEYTIVTSLSQHLSERYKRPESAIMVTVTHSACLMMGGSFEPAYILDITAIPSEVEPVTNKRNAYLVQCFVAEVLYVASNRGVVRFNALEEEKLATNGSTIAGEIERAEKDATSVPADEKRTGLVRSLTSKSSRKSMVGDKRKSVAVDNRKSIIRASSKKETNGDQSNGVFHTLERKFSTRSLRSVKSFKDRISPPVPTEMPLELLPSPTSISGFSMASSKQQPQLPNLPQIHRLSPLNDISGTLPKDSTVNTNKDLPPLSPLSQNPPTIPMPPPTPTSERNVKEAFVTSSSRRPSVSASIRPQSARKNLSNITGPAEAIPSPPPIPADLDRPMLTSRLSKRKSFVSLFRKGDGGIKV